MPVEDFSKFTEHARFRFASDADIEKLVTLINSAFVVERVAIEGDRIDRIGVRKYMATGRFLILESGDSMLGCVYLEKRGERGYLGLLAVHPAKQSRGIGRRLASEAEKSFREQGCSTVDLRVISARAELVPFYESLGFVLQGTSPMPENVPLKVPCHYVHMSKILK